MYHFFVDQVSITYMLLVTLHGSACKDEIMCIFLLPRSRFVCGAGSHRLGFFLDTCIAAPDPIVVTVLTLCLSSKELASSARPL